MRVKPLMSILLLALLLANILLGCQSEQDKIYDELTKDSSSTGLSSQIEELSSLEEDDLKGELTLIDTYTGDRNVGLPAIAQEFMKLHPKVQIKIEAGIPVSELETPGAYENFMQQIAVELMSGEAPDIMGTLGNLTPRDCASANLLYDLYQWMEQDENFVLDDYYRNLFEALEYDGKLFTLPIGFSCDVVFLNQHILDGLGIKLEPWDSLDYTDILSISRQAEEEGLVAEDYTLEYMGLNSGYSLFYQVEIPDFINMQESTVRFDSPEFIDYLNATKGILSSQEMDGSVVTLSGSKFVNEFAESNESSNTSLFFKTSIGLEDLTTLAYPPEGCVGPLLLTSRQGTVAFYPSPALSVPTSCKDPELAWEFLKFCIAPVEKAAYWNQYRPDGSVDIARGVLPVAKENMRAYGDLYAQICAAREEKQSGGTTSFVPNTSDSPLVQPFWDNFSEFVSSANATKGYYFGLSTIVDPILLDFYRTDSLSPENCAKLMQEKAGLYFGER